MQCKDIVTERPDVTQLDGEPEYVARRSMGRLRVIHCGLLRSVRAGGRLFGSGKSILPISMTALLRLNRPSFRRISVMCALAVDSASCSSWAICRFG